MFICCVLVTKEFTYTGIGIGAEFDNSIVCVLVNCSFHLIVYNNHLLIITVVFPAV